MATALLSRICRMYGKGIVRAAPLRFSPATLIPAPVSPAPPRGFATLISAFPLAPPSVPVDLGSAVSARHWPRHQRAICSGRTSAGDFTVWQNGGGLVHRDADVHHTARVEAGAVVHEGAIVGDGAVVHSGGVLGPEVELGSRSRVGYSASLENCSVGQDCVLHSGVRVGQDGFGFFHDASGSVVKKEQSRRVVVMDGVEVGANSCIDRGSWRDTIIGEHTKMDNMVQIGHNVVIGKGCLICAHCAIGGSAELGDYVIMGGKAAVKDHVTIASKVRIAAKAGVAESILEAGDYAGFPAVAAGQWRRSAVLQRRQRRQKKE